MTYRSDVDALAARTQALAAEVAAKTKELDASRSMLDEAVAKTRLPVLPNIKVATPCSADWAQMSGDERVRACGSCSKNVYNLSSLTRDEAEALILEKEGKLCVRYYQRKDGTILLKDCSIGIVQKRRRRVIAAGVAALLGGGVFAAIKLTRPEPSPRAAIFDAPTTIDDLTTPPAIEPEPDMIMGEIGPSDVHATMGAVAIDPTPPDDEPTTK
jgi:hypothetical protein